jgi:hypothetical protein
MRRLLARVNPAAINQTNPGTSSAEPVRRRARTTPQPRSSTLVTVVCSFRCPWCRGRGCRLAFPGGRDGGGGRLCRYRGRGFRCRVRGWRRRGARSLRWGWRSTGKKIGPFPEFATVTADVAQQRSTSFVERLEVRRSRLRIGASGENEVGNVEVGLRPVVGVSLRVKLAGNPERCFTDFVRRTGVTHERWVKVPMIDEHSVVPNSGQERMGWLP